MAEIETEEMNEIKEAFLVFDRKGDDKIDIGDVGNLLRALNLNPTNLTVKKVTDGAVAGSKRIAVEDFLPMYTQAKEVKDVGTYADFYEGLKVYDKEEKEMILGAELQHVLQTLGERLTDKEAEDILKGLEDSDGNVSIDAFINHIMAPPPGQKKKDDW
ncbi:PREDICTED: myosin light chain 3, skeletal muscle isoform-like [Priapulus caudatus]|uniref:Myosin light chain 3, skeletal muscle isoform-like n=1 Tax=Priapulus caudatus TaxID=37621 RepID=A0ABM1F7F8_PRICU|nr:PREDICTED: myosin light chain 3, skeletal muscle isoform-like [Priapulus caudatus]